LVNERSFRSLKIFSTLSQTEDKRGRILSAAVEVFAQRGFFSARVNDIARCAGVADGTIYRYFKGKDDLLISLFEDRMEKIIKVFRQELGTLNDPREALRRFMELQLRLVVDQPQLAAVLTVELRQSARFMRNYQARAFSEYLALLDEILAQGQARGLFRLDLNRRLLGRALFGALDEISLHWISSQGNPPYELSHAAGELWSIFKSGILIPTNREEERCEDSGHIEASH